jgi:hypothetical protein
VNDVATLQVDDHDAAARLGITAGEILVERQALEGWRRSGVRRSIEASHFHSHRDSTPFPPGFDALLEASRRYYPMRAW